MSERWAHARRELGGKRLPVRRLPANCLDDGRAPGLGAGVRASSEVSGTDTKLQGSSEVDGPKALVHINDISQGGGEEESRQMAYHGIGYRQMPFGSRPMPVG
jgi:hypothetical protein